MKSPNNLTFVVACVASAWLWTHHASAGTLIGSDSPAPASVNLTAEGTVDWAHWGVASQSDFNHKSPVANQISDVTITGNANQFDDAGIGYSWSDGTPTASAVFSTTGLFIEGLSNAPNKTNQFQFTVAAGTGVRILRIYAGAWMARVRLEARLSDGSAPVYINDTLNDTGSGTSLLYTLRYAANSAGQTLTIRIYALSLHNPDGNCTLMAASLGNPPTGALSGGATLLPNGEVVNLTSEGTLDWAHWGLAAAGDFNHKNGVVPRISNVTTVGSGTVQQIGTVPAAYVWSDGTPTLNSSNTSGISILGAGNGFQFTVPASTTTNLLRVYVTAYSARVHFEASISDGSSPAFHDDSFDTSDLQQGPVRVYSVRYAAASAGQTLTAKCTVLLDQGSGWVSLQGATLQLPSAQVGILGGGHTVLAVASTIDLTADGRIDWAHWGLAEPTDLDRKLGGSNVISDFSIIGLDQSGGPLEVQWFGDNFTGYSWTNGTPTLAATNTGSGVWLAQPGLTEGPGLNSGFQVSVPADTSVKALKLYVGAYGARMHFEAFLSDGSAPPFIDESFSNESDGPNRVYTLTFAAASAGQKLIVRYWVSSLFDSFGNVTLQSAVLREAAPIVSLVTPVNTSIFNDPAGGLLFTASTIEPFSIAANQVGLVLNGVDVSSSLVVSGTATARSAVYTNLAPNKFYSGQIRAVDNLGGGATNFITFDTFSTNGVVVIETEDYNYNSGQFIDNPVPGAYATLVGGPEIDYHALNAGANLYRPSDPQEIFEAVEERPYFVVAGVPNYAVEWIEAEDWLNYTRTYANGVYRVYLRYGATDDQTLTLDRVTSDRTQPNQTVSNIGVFYTPLINTSAIYRYATLTDTNGNPLVVSLSGVQTLRLGNVDPGGLITDFLMLVPSVEVPLSIVRSGGQVTISFPSQSGFSYTLQYKTNLTDSSWQNILPVITGDGTTKSVIESIGQPSRFYRLSIQ